MVKEISIAQFWRDFKAMDKGTKLLFKFPAKVEDRELFKVETQNIITIRAIDNKKVWMGKPKKDNKILKGKYTYTIKNYLCDGDLIIGGMF